MFQCKKGQILFIRDNASNFIYLTINKLIIHAHHTLTEAYNNDSKDNQMATNAKLLDIMYEFSELSGDLIETIN